MIRVAALQFAVGGDVEENLATCLRMIDAAAREHAPQLMVLPGIVNHYAFYEDVAQAEVQALSLDGDFLSAIAQRAAQHRCQIAVNVTLRGDAGLTITSLLYDEEGALIAQADKQTLLPHERPFFVRGEHGPAVVETRVGAIGLLAGEHAFTMESTRVMALRGASIVCTNQSAFGRDEATLHALVRALENRVFVVRANRSGLLASPAMRDRLLEAESLPAACLEGGGDSQIIAPDGRVLAQANSTEEAIVVADIDPRLAQDKLRADGSHLFALRRPELYRALSSRPRDRTEEPCLDGLSVATLSIANAESVESALAEATEGLKELAQKGADLVVLPELFYLPHGKVEHPAAAADLFATVVRALAEAVRDTPTQVILSAVERIGAELFHMGLVVGSRGVIARQPQVHVPLRHAWATPGRRVDSFRLFWGRLAIAVGDDLAVPELARLHALHGVELIAVPFASAEPGELSLYARARSAENRVCVAASARADAPEAGVICQPEREFNLSRPFRERLFDGHLLAPETLVMAAGDRVLVRELVLSSAHDKLLWDDMDVLASRPYWLSSELTRKGLGVPQIEKSSVGDAASSEAVPVAQVDGGEPTRSETDADEAPLDSADARADEPST